MRRYCLYSSIRHNFGLGVLAGLWFSVSIGNFSAVSVRQQTALSSALIWREITRRTGSICKAVFDNWLVTVVGYGYLESCVRLVIARVDLRRGFCSHAISFYYYKSLNDIFKSARSCSFQSVHSVFFTIRPTCECRASWPLQATTQRMEVANR